MCRNPRPESGGLGIESRKGPGRLHILRGFDDVEENEKVGIMLVLATTLILIVTILTDDWAAASVVRTGSVRL